MVFNVFYLQTNVLTSMLEVKRDILYIPDNILAVDLQISTTCTIIFVLADASQ